MKVTAAAAAILLATPFQANAQGAVSQFHASLSRQAVELDCTLSDADLRVASVQMHISGGRAFALPAGLAVPSPIPRLTNQELAIVTDENGIFDGATIEQVAYRPGHGSAVVRYDSGDNWNLRINSRHASDAPDVVGVELANFESAQDGALERKFAGFCKQFGTDQQPLSDEETAAWLQASGNDVDVLLQGAVDAIPPPAAPVPRINRVQRPPAADRTAAIVPLPLQNIRCQLIGSDLSNGALQFTLEGGRGYQKPGRNSRRVEVETTRRLMRIDLDDLGLFSDKFPIEDIRFGAGPQRLFQAVSGGNWVLDLENSAASTANVAQQELVKMTFAPARAPRGTEAELVYPHSFIGLCTRNSEPQMPLSPEETREEMWK